MSKKVNESGIQKMYESGIHKKLLDARVDIVVRKAEGDTCDENTEARSKDCILNFWSTLFAQK
jgi:hypothetical protein